MIQFQRFLTPARSFLRNPHVGNSTRAFAKTFDRSPSSIRVISSSSKNMISSTISHKAAADSEVKTVEDPIVPISLEVAKQSPREFEEMSNDAIAIMAICGEQEAKEERLIREIMRADGITWDEAQPTFRQMKTDNRKGMYWATLPYKLGLYTATFSAFACIPMVFDLDTCLAFNEYFVTTDVADPEDLETALEVGSWSWNWMEPPLGTISFSLLCLQFARNQMQNLQATPYTEWVKNRRAARLCNQYPKYNPYIVGDFAKNDKWGI